MRTDINKDSRENLIKAMRELAIQYCMEAKPTIVYLGFKKDIDKSYIITTQYPIPQDEVLVQINDVSNCTDPKNKRMSREDFDNTFDVLSYGVEEKREIIEIIGWDYFNAGEYMGKKKFVYNFD